MTSPYFSFGGLEFWIPRHSDVEVISDLRNTMSTWENLTDPRPVGILNQRKWVEECCSGGGRYYFIVRLPLGDTVGLVRMDEHDSINRSIRVGADVIPVFRGKGFGGRIYKAIKSYCFDHLNAHRIWLAVLETNQIAIRLYKREGFAKEGVYREAVFRGGRYVDYVIMSLLEREYIKQKRGVR